MTVDGPRDWPAIRLDLGPSLRLSFLLACPYGLGVLAIAGLPWPLVLRLAAIAGLVWLAVRAIREHGTRTAEGSIRAIEWCPDGLWRLELVGQAGCTARLAPHGFVHAGVVVIGLDGVERRRRVLILGLGNADDDDLRRLRVRLLLGRGSRTSPVVSRLDR